MLSTHEAAEATGIPRRTINWAINTCRLPATRLGRGAWMIDPDDLDAWAADQAASAVTAARNSHATQQPCRPLRRS